MKRRTLQSILEYNRVVLAVEWLARDSFARKPGPVRLFCHDGTPNDSAICMATDAEIAVEAGVSVPAVRRSLREMQGRELIAIFDTSLCDEDKVSAGLKPEDEDWTTRSIVNLDHPDAAEGIATEGGDCGRLLGGTSRVQALVAKIIAADQADFEAFHEAEEAKRADQSAFGKQL